MFVERCAECADSKPCAECNNEYVLSTDNCKKYRCSDRSFYDEKTGFCKDCPEGCETCSSSSFCKSCRKFYYLKDGKYLSCLVKDCERCSSESKCYTCSGAEIPHEEVSDCEPYKNFDYEKIIEVRHENNSNSDIKAGAIVGIVLGIILFVIIIVVSLICYKKRIKNQKIRNSKPFHDEGVNIDRNENKIIKNEI